MGDCITLEDIERMFEALWNAPPPEPPVIWPEQAALMQAAGIPIPEGYRVIEYTRFVDIFQEAP